ncbi:ABC transporter permease [Thalassobius sp. Cn5-15]|jgi:capsular polysaccharide transport system permease protein|uniref:ABC transporter permease n=1 Tax=Thalassobius sp. Cn5-15 TaxID=2917763 RepID=UPI001EF3BAEC|nr:ABC transporter permease [Thalassobius sp. Cn5-15]MCG7495027.1 ABC transporter permease [Thalassobius sp. Cn5-15]
MEDASRQVDTQAPLPPSGRSRHGAKRRFATFRAVAALMLREMATRYGRASGGYVWAVLEPLGTIAMLAFGFSLVLATPPLGNSFILFFAAGFLPFNLSLGIATMVERMIHFSRPLLFYPAVTWLDAMLARVILNTLTALLVMVLLFTAILMLTDTTTVVQMGPIVLACALAVLLGSGVGLINCVIGGLFPTWERVWAILTRPLFLASGIFYTFESLPRQVQEILWWNPIVHIVSLMRTGFYPMYRASHVSLGYVVAVSLICLLLGLILMQRHHRTLLQG